MCFHYDELKDTGRGSSCYLADPFTTYLQSGTVPDATETVRLLDSLQCTRLDNMWAPRYSDGSDCTDCTASVMAVANMVRGSNGAIPVDLARYIVASDMYLTPMKRMPKLIGREVGISSSMYA